MKALVARKRRFSGAWAAIVPLFLLLTIANSSGETAVTVEHLDADDASPSFSFGRVISPSKNDVAARGKFTVLSGRLDPNSGGVGALNDDQLPSGEDEPRASFFFEAGTEGGQLLLDLGEVVAVRQVCTYSWHPGSRAPQFYELYGLEIKTEGAVEPGSQPGNPQAAGMNLISKVDTRPNRGEPGGQYAVSISGGGSPIGSFRYLLFKIHCAENNDPFGNTFFSEIDVLDSRKPEPIVPPASQSKPKAIVVETAGGKYAIRIDASETPDLEDWTRQRVGPMVREWYPKIVEMLPSPAYEAAPKVSIKFRERQGGVAETSGNRIVCTADFIRQNLSGESLGAIFHELVHVIQHYDGAVPAKPDSVPPPGWLVEGIADYLRWFVFEPQSRGAEIPPGRAGSVKFSDSYRVTANFLNWVTKNADRDAVRKLNAAIRQGAYTETLWQEYTGRSLEQLGSQWKKALAEPSAGSQAR